MIELTEVPAAQLPPVLTSEMAASLMRCSSKTVEEDLRSGLLPGEKHGEGWTLPTAAFIGVLNTRAMEAMKKRREAPRAAAVAANQDNVRELGRKGPPKLPEMPS